MSHQPRQVRGPIETPEHVGATLERGVTSRAKCAALLKHPQESVDLLLSLYTSPAAPSARPY